MAYPAPLHPHARFASVYALLKTAVAEHVFPGCSFAVFAEGAVAVLDAVGRQTYAEDAPAIVPGTVYDLASLTKVIATTAMAMLLYERGQLSLDRPLHTILADFGSDGDRGRVTLQHLLAHASGLPGYARLFETASSADELFHVCLKLPLAHKPGTHSEYSDIGFILLGRALEQIAGEPIHSFCAREVFAPCSMTSTRFQPPAASRAAIPPTENDTTFRHRIVQGEVQDENCFVLGGVSGHAGLFGSAPDVLAFAAAVLGVAAPPAAGTLFQLQTLRLFAARAGLPPGSARALGWDTPSPSADGASSAGTFFSPNSIGHLGYAGTSLWIDLESRIAVVLLTNRTWPSRDNQEIRKLRPLFHDAVCNALKVPVVNV